MPPPHRSTRPVTYPAPIEQVMTPVDQALLRSRRQRLLQKARGRVLELGGAGGVNFEHYRAGDVTSVVVVGAEGPSRDRLARSAARRGLSRFELADQSSLDGCFDTVVATFTLSARNDLQGDLRSLAERLSPDGRLLFLDHSPRRAPGLATELTRPLWRFLADGFVAGRDLPGTLRTSGFTIVDLERFGLPTLTLPLRSCVAGVARAQRPGGARRVEGSGRGAR